MPRPWPRFAWLVLPAGLAVALLLAWRDVLPGGWRMRSWVTPHRVREAREQAVRAAARIEQFETEAPRAAEGSVLFLGSSTIERFPLESAFPEATCLNLGIGNETARELLARLDRSLPDAPPSGAVLYTASVDFRRDHSPPRLLRRRVESVVERLREHYPGLPVALIGLLPEWRFPADDVGALAAANAALRDLARERDLAFIATDRPPITTPDGSLSKDHSADRLHLDERGYRVLAGWLLEEGGEVAERLAGP